MLYGISVGPGDPELLTLKAARILNDCTVIAYPCADAQADSVAWTIVLGALPELAQKRQLRLILPMTRDEAKLEEARASAVAQLIEALAAGEQVAVLTLGDASVYSTYMYLHERVTAAGYEAQIIPGVPSFCAAAALRGGRLTAAEKPLHIVPASDRFLAESLSWPGPKILMKTGKALKRVKDNLQEKGLLETACLVQECGMAGERVCSLSEVEESGYFSVIFVEDQT